MAALFFSLLISLVAGTNPQAPSADVSKTNTTTQTEQTISTFGGASTWSDVTE